MIVQSILYPCPPCIQKELYYKCDTTLEQHNECLNLPPDSEVSFFSYINMFDTDTWRKYTVLSAIDFSVELQGQGYLLFKCRTEQHDVLLSKHYFASTESEAWNVFSYQFDLNEMHGCCYFEIISESEVQIRNAYFKAPELTTVNKKIQIALNICTYHRNQDIQRSLKQLKKSRFFRKDDELFGKLKVMIVDNGSELELIDEPCIKLVHNINNGGSGGFKRGLEEIRCWDDDISHVVFMDDDVEFLSESLYRLYALFFYIRKEYCQESVAGRMFRMDKRFVQYTAAEIWNCGNLQHIGLNADMTHEEEILRSNKNTNAEYGGWWFCCYPMDFVRSNDPLPFFIHCDDVEYGLRHGGTPIILNGIQVWHETYEYRQSAVMAYYDMRNSLFVNEKLEEMKSGEKSSAFYRMVIEKWKQEITTFHLKKDWNTEYCLIIALLDWMKGMERLKKFSNDRFHQSLIKRKSFRLKNAICWRYATYKFKRNYLDKKEI